VLRCRQSRTENRSRKRAQKTSWNLDLSFSRYANGETNKHTDNADRHISHP